MRRYAALAGKSAAVLALSVSPLLIHGALSLDVPARVAAQSNTVGHLLTAGLVAASGLPHAIVYVGLLSTFGPTLLPGREPLVSWIARHISGGVLSEEMMVYTRGVTSAWCLFFAAQLSASLLLLSLASIETWSFFVNVLNLPLLAAMFASEYIFRRLYLRDPPRHTPADVMRALGYFEGTSVKRRGAG